MAYRKKTRGKEEERERKHEGDEMNKGFERKGIGVRKRYGNERKREREEEREGKTKK